MRVADIVRKTVDHHLVDRPQSSGGVHHERHDRGPSAPIDGELDGSRIGPIEAVERRRRFEAHPTALAEAEQPGAEATSMGVGRPSQGIHTRGDPMDHSVGDQSVLLPGGDADVTELRDGHHAVLVGGEVGEGGVELHAHPWVANRRRRKTPVCVTVLLARPNRTVTQTGWRCGVRVGSGGVGCQIWRVAGGWPRMSVITSRASALRSSVTKTRAIGSRLVIIGLRL